LYELAEKRLEDAGAYIGDSRPSLSGVVGLEDSIPASLKVRSNREDVWNVERGELGIDDRVWTDCIDHRWPCPDLGMCNGVIPDNDGAEGPKLDTES